jgi:hypothetical protein
VRREGNRSATCVDPRVVTAPKEEVFMRRPPSRRERVRRRLVTLAALLALLFALPAIARAFPL